MVGCEEDGECVLITFSISFLMEGRALGKESRGNIVVGGRRKFSVM